MSLLTELEMSTEVGAKQKNPKDKDLACVHCRKWHTKCDRKKPTCSLCIERNIVCLYEKAPKKRGPRGGKVPVLDDIKKIEDEIERYRQLASFYEQKTHAMEKQYSQLFSEGLLLIEPRGMFKLSNSMLFHSLVDIYMWGGYPSYEIKPPFKNLEEFEKSQIYTPQKGLMYSILASASAYTGDFTLYKQLEYETKATIGPLFDNSNCADIAQSHFMMAEAQMSMGDCEKAAFYVDIARRSTSDFVSKFNNKPQAKHLQRVSDFTSACLLAWAGYIDEALKLVDQFYYALDSYSLSGEEPNYVFQLNILQLKITLEASQLISQNRTATVKQYNAWVAMADQGDQLLKYTERFPEQMRKILEVYNEAIKALIFYVGNQPQFVLECVKAVLEIAKHPICVCSYWSTTIVAVVVGFCFVYDWQEELEVALGILEESAPRHPTSALINRGVRETLAKHGKNLSFGDFVSSIKRSVDHTSSLFNNEEGSNKGSMVELLTSSSVSSPGVLDSTSPMSDPHMDGQPEETIHTDMIFHDDASAFLEQIMSGGSSIMEEAVNPFIFNTEPEYSEL
jgi:hypothetical protein